MARDSADGSVERIPSMIGDILSRDEHSSVVALDSIVQSFSRQNSCNLPPIMITAEDREELQRDRENAMKCEQALARQKQEKYFDLVDKVQNVLRRIEMKNSQKSQNIPSEGSPSDYNNNPSETSIENMDSFTSPKPIQRTTMNFGEASYWKNPGLPSGKQRHRHSLPANFDTIYPSAGHDKSTDGITVGRHHAYSNMRRPVSAYSDSRMVYGGNVGWNGNLDGGHVPVSNHHMYPPYQRPLSVMSDNHLLYGGSNGHHGSGQETLHHVQSNDQRSLSVMSENHPSDGSHGYSVQHSEVLQPSQNGQTYTDYHQLYSNGSLNMNRHISQEELPQMASNSALRNGDFNAFTHSSLVDNSSVSKSQNSISKQREVLALQQKQLEDHYAALQGQLLADFQTKQQELLDVYNQSLDPPPSTETGQATMDSIVEGSLEFDSEETIVSSSIERFTLLRTEELPQSPFGISVRKHSYPFQNGEGMNSSRSMEYSVKQREQDSNGFPKSHNNGSRLQHFSSSSHVPQYPNSSNDTRLANDSSDQMLSNASRPPPNSQPRDRRVEDTSLYFLQSSASPDARKSFNSEISAQEYYEMPRFGENGEKPEHNGKKVERNLQRKNGVVGKAGKNHVKKLGGSVVTSPKRTRLNSFESEAMKHLKNTQSHKFFVVSAYAKGFLTRLLFQTAKIVGLKTTVKDAKSVLAEMNTESSPSITDRSFKERVKAQLHSAQSELCEIFVESSADIRMQILEHNRKLLQEKEARNAIKVYSAGISQTRPKLSNVTKKRISRQESHEKTPKSDKASSSSKVSRVSAKDRSTPKSSTKNTPNTSTAKTTPKNKPKSEVSPVSDQSTLGSETSQQTHSASSANVVTTSTTTSVPVITTASKKPAEKKQETKKSVKNTSSLKSGKANIKVTQTSKNRRRTWDVGVLKPIQGRISPTIPSERIRSSNEKRQSTLSTARKVGQKVVSEYETNGLAGQSTKCEISGIDMSKTYKVTNKSEQPIKKTGARRSLAANLSQK